MTFALFLRALHGVCCSKWDLYEEVYGQLNPKQKWYVVQTYYGTKQYN